MGRKDKTSVGRTVMKSRSKGGNLAKGKENWLHTSELNDGEEPNTKSVTEQSALDEFLTTAELAGTEFVAEKLNISIFNVDHNGGLPSKNEEKRIQELQDQHRQFLQIPRRPKWDETTTPEQLDQLEKENFLAWRRALAQLQEKDDLILTPFERNLEFWRQLWRVIERSNVVVQIVDARNPLLFRCEDLESYVTEVNKHKVNVLLINKADFLTQKQRETWASYFKSINVKAVFWSAVFEAERLKQMELLEETKSLPSQPEVVKEKTEVVLTDNHVTQFLHLKVEPDNTESNIQALTTSDDELDLYGQSDQGGKDPVEREGLKHDPRKSDSQRGEVDPTSDGPIQTEVKANSDVEQGRVFSKHNISELLEGDKNSAIEDDKNDAIEGDNQESKCDVIAKAECSIEDINLNMKEHLNDMEEETKLRAENDIRTDGHSHRTAENSSIFENDLNTNVAHIAGKNVEFYTSGHLLTGEELLVYCQWLHHQYGDNLKTGKEEQQTVIGLVGYPNVGKSSTINAILQSKKVPVSSTPGRTKHFQTLLVDKTVCLCDCPGLVFPSFVSTKAEMVISGILPIDQLRDHVPPVTLVCRRIPRDVLETVYGITLSKPEEWEDPDRPPYAEEFLDAYSHSRGFLTSQGRSDSPRSSRYILKDYVNGKLLYCHPPPTVDAKDFQIAFTTEIKTVKKRPPTSSQTRNKTHVEKMDGEFFKKKDVKFYTSATTGTEQYRKLMETAQSDPNIVIVGKPWKKHGNRNKKEKLRRLKPNDY